MFDPLFILPPAPPAVFYVRIDPDNEFIAGVAPVPPPAPAPEAEVLLANLFSFGVDIPLAPPLFESKNFKLLPSIYFPLEL